MLKDNHCEPCERNANESRSIYSCKPGQEKIPTGMFLGQMTDELEGDLITEFGAAGPKSYSYKTSGGISHLPVSHDSIKMIKRSVYDDDFERFEKQNAHMSTEFYV